MLSSGIKYYIHNIWTSHKKGGAKLDPAFDIQDLMKNVSPCFMSKVWSLTALWAIRFEMDADWWRYYQYYYTTPRLHHLNNQMFPLLASTKYPQTNKACA